MRYLERDPDGRSDPARILQGCRSVLCLSAPYDGKTPDPAAGDARLGRISRYAWGDDYHEVMKGMLDALRSRIETEWPDARTRAAVDSSPVLEKAFAAAAGLGWMGKHTNIIDPDRGSWFFLAELFTTLPLPADPPIADHCGSCTRCIDACPTGAIVEPYVLDAGLCISYWTIEHRGSLDPEIADRADNWIFGCDVCQDVCPWNRADEPVPVDPRFEPRPGLLGRAAAEWAGISAEDFSARSRGSALRRAKHEGVARNARAAMANAGRPAAKPGSETEGSRPGGVR
jgi:epoxyqueuosine reductase